LLKCRCRESLLKKYTLRPSLVAAPTLAAGCLKFGFLFMAKMYIVPYWINVMWLDVVTYLHHTDKEVYFILIC